MKLGLVGSAVSEKTFEIVNGGRRRTKNHGNTISPSGEPLSQSTCKSTDRIPLYK